MALFAAACALALGACGDSDSSASSDAPETPPPLSDQEVRAAAKGSPERAILEWWRALQFQDPVTGYDFLSRKLKSQTSAEEFRTQIPLLQGRVTGRPEVVDIVKTGGGTKARALIQIAFPSGTLNRTLELVREGGKWRLADDFFIRESIRAAQTAASAKSAAPTPPDAPRTPSTDEPPTPAETTATP